MRAGRLKHRIEVQSYEEGGVDDYGYREPGGWVTLATIWADVAGIHGREFISANAEVASTTWRISCRYLADVDASMRLKEGDRIFNIKAVLPNNDKTSMVLMCETGVNEG